MVLGGLTAPGACCDGVMETVNDSRRRHAQKKARMAKTAPAFGADGDDIFGDGTELGMGAVDDDEKGAERPGAVCMAEMDTFGAVSGTFGGLEEDGDFDRDIGAAGALRRDYLEEVRR